MNTTSSKSLSVLQYARVIRDTCIDERFVGEGFEEGDEYRAVDFLIKAMTYRTHDGKTTYLETLEITSNVGCGVVRLFHRYLDLAQTVDTHPDVLRPLAESFRAACDIWYLG